MNALHQLDALLSDPALRDQNEIRIDPAIGERAKRPLDRMLAFQGGQRR